jgi:hypothetical protein
MLRRIAAVIFGFFISAILFTAFQFLIRNQYPPPDGFNYYDYEALDIYLKSLPNKMFVLITGAFAISTFFGSLFTAKKSEAYKVYMGLIVGGMMLVGVISYISVMQAPKWMVIAAPLAIFISAFIGGKIGAATKK